MGEVPGEGAPSTGCAVPVPGAAAARGGKGGTHSWGAPLRSFHPFRQGSEEKNPTPSLSCPAAPCDFMGINWDSSYPPRAKWHPRGSAVSWLPHRQGDSAVGLAQGTNHTKLYKIIQKPRPRSCRLQDSSTQTPLFCAGDKAPHPHIREDFNFSHTKL